MADIAAQIQSLRDSQIQANTSALGAARDQSMSALGVENSKIDPQYYKDRNVASSANQLQQKNFGEFLANRNQSNSGLAGQSVISNGAAMQGQLGVLNTAQTAAHGDINRRQTEVGNVYSNGIASATAAANSQAMTSNIAESQRQAAAQQAQAQFDAQQAQARDEFTRNLAFQQTQLASDNANQAANRAASARSSAASSAAKGPTAAQQAASAKQNTQAATADAFSRLNELANQGQTRDQIITAYSNNYSTFSNGGADMDALYKAIDSSFKWNG